MTQEKENPATTAGSTQTMVTMAHARKDSSTGGTDSIGESENSLSERVVDPPHSPSSFNFRCSAK